MFRSNWTILREHLRSLAKVTILWNQSEKLHSYMLCGVVVANISACDVCTACRVVCDFILHTFFYNTVFEIITKGRERDRIVTLFIFLYLSHSEQEVISSNRV